MKHSKKSKPTATPPASPTEKPERPSYLTLTEDTAKRALIEARGDIFIASQMLNIPALRLNREIKVSPALQSVIDAVRELGKGVSEAALREAVDSRMAMYRVVGLDALHDLAAMPIDENSAQNQVKFAAAARLTDGLAGGSTGGEMADTFKELADLYQQHAPRVRLVRERTTVEISAPAERVVNDEHPKR